MRHITRKKKKQKCGTVGTRSLVLTNVPTAKMKGHLRLQSSVPQTGPWFPLFDVKDLSSAVNHRRLGVAILENTARRPQRHLGS